MTSPLPHMIISEMHGELLRRLSAYAQCHFSGLQQVARHFRTRKQLSNSLSRKVGNVDIVFNYMRHITTIGATAFIEEVFNELHSHTQPASVAPPSDAPESTMPTAPRTSSLPEQSSSPEAAGCAQPAPFAEKTAHFDLSEPELIAYENSFIPTLPLTMMDSVVDREIDLEDQMSTSPPDPGLATNILATSRRPLTRHASFHEAALHGVAPCYRLNAGLLAAQTNCSMDEAIQALTKCQNDLADALLVLVER